MLLSQKMFIVLLICVTVLLGFQIIVSRRTPAEQKTPQFKAILLGQVLIGTSMLVTSVRGALGITSEPAVMATAITTLVLTLAAAAILWRSWRIKA